MHVSNKLQCDASANGTYSSGALSKGFAALFAFSQTFVGVEGTRTTPTKYEKVDGSSTVGIWTLRLLLTRVEGKKTKKAKRGESCE
jgi:hypothetical protein